MSYTDYTDQIEEFAVSTPVEDTCDGASIEQWELSDFEDILQ